MRNLYSAVFIVLTASILPLGCGDDDDDEGELTGQECDTPDECYPNVEDRTTLRGEIVCMERVEDGYCTHFCQTDEDCCAVDGECRTELPQVCGPFESTGMMFCFLSCENVDLDRYESENDFCQREAHRSFTCRSTGGGSLNRKVCVPSG